MADIFVVSENALIIDGNQYRCAIGKAGFAVDKREGDHKTPIGVFAIRECYYRPDKLAKPATALDIRVTSDDDGWCDDPVHPAYNTHVKLPFAASHEKLWREDDVYDVVVVLGYNDSPVVAGNGSAIFMHVAKPDYAGTEGCVALSREDMLQVLKRLTPDSKIHILPQNS